MSKKLLIVESPSKAKTIQKYLGKDFTVLSSVGHVRDLPKNNKKAIDIEAGFVPTYEISVGKEKVISEIKKVAKTAEEIFLATDPDREGEAIAWHLKEVLKLENAKRVTFNEITESAVNEAIKNPREIDMNLKTAQEARRILDRLVGYDLSGLIWKKVRYGLSAGRVQSPALRIIMEREREIRAFIPEDFWIIKAKVDTAEKKKDGEKIEMFCDVEPKDQNTVDKILEIAKSGNWKVADIKETELNRSPKPPFITSTLQQVASTRLGFSPSRTMQVAQKLYESGHITYMRTDSPTLSGQAIAQAVKEIEKEYGKDFVQIRNFKAKSKNAQEAHEAIRPTKISIKSAGFNEEQKKLYSLIRNRTISSQMKDAKLLRTKISASINNGEIPNFSANGQRVLYPGWLLADPISRSEDVELPKVSEGQNLNLLEINSEAKQTEPPSRYTEAGLIKELEKRGIGRPSTYASIMKTLADREYVVRQGKTLIPTDTGDVVSSFLEQNFAKYISDDFTAEMENELDEIANGQRDYTKTMKDFYSPFTAEIKSKEDIAKLTTLGDAEKHFVCPKCKSEMNVKLGRGGKFLSCSKYPECMGALTIDGQEIKSDEPIGNHPDTGESVFVKVGRFGPYVQLGNGGLVDGGIGKNGKKLKPKKVKPKMASIPKGKNIEEVSIEDAIKYLSLPKALGSHPDTGEEIIANIGRFGPYIVHQGDFRSLKTDDVYEITFDRAIQILAEEKRVGRRGGKKKEK